jgi:hypothetical protein
LSNFRRDASDAMVGTASEREILSESRPIRRGSRTAIESRSRESDERIEAPTPDVYFMFSATEPRKGYLKVGQTKAPREEAPRGAQW